MSIDIFEEDKKPKKPKTPKTPKERTAVLIGRLTKEVERAARNWLETHFYGTDPRYRSGVDSYVEKVLERHISLAIDYAVGIDIQFGRVEVKYDSPLYKQIQELANKHAAAVLDRVFGGKAASTVLPDDILKAIKKTYRYAYIEALDDLAREGGRRTSCDRCQEPLQEGYGHRHRSRSMTVGERARARSFSLPAIYAALEEKEP